MIIRIVQMTFQEDRIDEFLSLFDQVKHIIVTFPGCTHLELWQDEDDKRKIFTYSYWDAPANLEGYRKSDFFKDTWQKTKPLFQVPPQAWSVQRIRGKELQENS